MLLIDFSSHAQPLSFWESCKILPIRIATFMYEHGLKNRKVAVRSEPQLHPLFSVFGPIFDPIVNVMIRDFDDDTIGQRSLRALIDLTIVLTGLSIVAGFTVGVVYLFNLSHNNSSSTPSSKPLLALDGYDLVSQEHHRQMFTQGITIFEEFAKLLYNNALLPIMFGAMNVSTARNGVCFPQDLALMHAMEQIESDQIPDTSFSCRLLLHKLSPKGFVCDNDPSFIVQDSIPSGCATVNFDIDTIILFFKAGQFELAVFNVLPKGFKWPFSDIHTASATHTRVIRESPTKTVDTASNQFSDSLTTYDTSSESKTVEIEKVTPPPSPHLGLGSNGYPVNNCTFFEDWKKHNITAAGLLGQYTCTSNVVSLQNLGLSSLQVAAIVPALQQLLIKTLIIVGNILKLEDVILIAQMIQDQAQLSLLSLANNNINDAGVTLVAVGISHCAELTKLTLNGNHISDSGLRSVTEELDFTKFSKLTSMNFAGNPEVTTVGCAAFVDEIHHSNTNISVLC